MGKEWKRKNGTRMEIVKKWTKNNISHAINEYMYICEMKMEAHVSKREHTSHMWENVGLVFAPRNTSCQKETQNRLFFFTFFFFFLITNEYTTQTPYISSELHKVMGWSCAHQFRTNNWVHFVCQVNKKWKRKITYTCVQIHNKKIFPIPILCSV